MKNTLMNSTEIPLISELVNTIFLDHIEGDIPALTSRNPDGSYTIALNNHYSAERLQQEFLHELKHIQEKHFDLATADEAEKKVRGISAEKQLFEEIDDYDIWLLAIFKAIEIHIALAEEKRMIEQHKQEIKTTNFVYDRLRDLENEERKKAKKNYRSSEPDRYPAGAYSEMKRRGWL